MASQRFFLVIGVLALLAVFIVVAILAYGEVFNPLPASCADSSGPSSLASAECHKNVVPYVAGLAVVGGATGALWRRLGR